ncbi:MAG: peptide-methionine (S)-S-oxide reductase MsrA [Bacteroidota bacterium]|nr:peptide-methionine (S)-S-oxide reductase MsrA [Bacteroidota bacterium]
MRKWQLFLFGILTSSLGFCQQKKNVQPDENMTIDTTKYEKAIYASGCFWGTEYYLKRAPGVIKTTVGYTGGHIENPTYQQVCGKNTGHFEAVEVWFDPKVTSYEELTKVFFETHDPTQTNGQGPDIGPQYRSAIFYVNEKQKEIAERLIALLEVKGMNVATFVLPEKPFYEGEGYHQDYYDNKGGTPYCHKYTKRF